MKNPRLIVQPLLLFCLVSAALQAEGAVLEFLLAAILALLVDSLLEARDQHRRVRALRALELETRADRLLRLGVLDLANQASQADIMAAKAASPGMAKGMAALMVDMVAKVADMATEAKADE